MACCVRKLFGPDQPVILQLLEIPPGMDRLRGVMMELQDSAFPLVKGIVGTSDANVAFKDADAIFLVGSRPRAANMDRRFGRREWPDFCRSRQGD